MNQTELEDHTEDNPTLSIIIERNIRTMIRLRLKAAGARTFQSRLADTVTTFSGRMVFVYLHVVWFSAWILLNTGWLGSRPFDPFPCGRGRR
jgi:uncharacterized membrane protein